MSELQPPVWSPTGARGEGQAGPVDYAGPERGGAGGAGGGGPVPAGSSPPAQPKRTHRTLIEWGAILVIAVVAAVLLRTFVIQPYYIPSGSM